MVTIKNHRFEIGPIRLESMWTRLISMADEAAAALLRASFSTVARDSNDLSAIVTDGDGRVPAQAFNSMPFFRDIAPYHNRLYPGVLQRNPSPGRCA